MKLVITIEMDNAAFGEHRGTQGEEVGRILQEYTDKLDKGLDLEQSLRDINGNTVGQAKVTGPSDRRNSQQKRMDAIHAGQFDRADGCGR